MILCLSASTADHLSSPLPYGKQGSLSYELRTGLLLRTN